MAGFLSQSQSGKGADRGEQLGFEAQTKEPLPGPAQKEGADLQWWGGCRGEGTRRDLEQKTAPFGNNWIDWQEASRMLFSLSLSFLPPEASAEMLQFWR